ncbi:hypothetical protein POM88_015190 [Heracleum sosnowskyi]|uniref:Uncharacterized protein n=1 Tax=Heracleum sosnowskyi TaxID=360622 RepID=A0AAD8IMD3_9APIA|nr:hypothetical protein POM88_015190 [Heracleum sosnowskyi]
MIEGDGERRKLVAVTRWVIWKLRNEVVWNDKGSGINTVVSLVHSTINQWDRAQDRNVNSLAAFVTEDDGAVKWIRPEGEVIKVNVDAATFEDTGRLATKPPESIRTSVNRDTVIHGPTSLQCRSS